MCSSQNFDMKLLAIFFDLGPLEAYVHETLKTKQVPDVPGQEWFHGTFEEIVGAIVRTAKENGFVVHNYFACVPVPATGTTC